MRDENEARDPAIAREWLTMLVTETHIAYSTQKQVLNALVFFFRDVCGMEKVNLRVKDIDLDRGLLTVLSGKGNKDRTTMIPKSLKTLLKVQLDKCRELWSEDRSDGIIYNERSGKIWMAERLQFEMLDYSVINGCRGAHV